MCVFITAGPSSKLTMSGPRRQTHQVHAGPAAGPTALPPWAARAARPAHLLSMPVKDSKDLEFRVLGLGVLVL